MVGFSDRLVEPANAPKARSEGDLIHRQAGLVDKLLREVQTPGSHHRAGRGSEVTEEQPPKVARPDAEALREGLHTAGVGAALIQAALIDEPQRSHHGARSSRPAGCSGRTLGTAAQAGAKAGFRSGRGAGKVADVAFLRGPRSANRPTIDAGAEY